MATQEGGQAGNLQTRVLLQLGVEVFPKDAHLLPGSKLEFDFIKYNYNNNNNNNNNNNSNSRIKN